MHRIALVVSLSLAACAIPTHRVSDAAVEEVPPSAEARRVRLQQLAPAERAKVVASAQALVVNCPYTRASWQLPLVMESVVSGLDRRDVAPRYRVRLKQLQAHLKAQVAALDLLELDLRQPIAGNHLYGAVGLVTRAELSTSADPIGSTQALIDQNDTLVETMSKETQELIRRHNDVVYDRMGQTTFFHQTTRAQELLEELLPGVTNPKHLDALRRLIAALDAHATHGC